MKIYLRIGSELLNEAEIFATKKEAIAHFTAQAKGLYRYGQRLEGTLHYPYKGAIAEYPDYILSVGKRGGIVIGLT